MSAKRNEAELSAKMLLLAYGSFAGGTPALPAMQAKRLRYQLLGDSITNDARRKPMLIWLPLCALISS
jgi:hypothetical protein